MELKNGIKINTAIFILLFINFIFAYKYIERVTPLGIYISLLLVFLQSIVYYIKVPLRIQYIFSYLVLFYLILLVCISWKYVPIESLNVDRYSVINAFFEELFKGNYPYYAKSHQGNYPGPMPVYFLIALPFYLIGELSILSVLGYAIFTLMLMHKIKKGINSSFVILYLASAIFCLWEITTRSNIFTYSVLLLILITQSEKMKAASNRSIAFHGLLIGLLMSTRNIYLLVLVIFWGSSLLRKDISIKQLSILVTSSIVSFIFTFIPFLVAFYDDFFKMNPFIIQSSALVPTQYTLGFIGLSCVLCFFVKNKDDTYFYSGLSLFFSILIYGIFHISKSGFQTAFYGSRIDVSYFIFCVPFFCYYILIRSSNPEIKEI